MLTFSWKCNPRRGEREGWAEAGNQTSGVTEQDRLVAVSSETPHGAPGPLSRLSKERKRVEFLCYPAHSLLSLPKRCSVSHTCRLHVSKVSHLDASPPPEATGKPQESREEASSINLGEGAVGCCLHGGKDWKQPASGPSHVCWLQGQQ